MYPTLAANPDYTAIVNQRHYQRLTGLIDDARAKGARIVPINPAGETLPATARKLAPTLILDVTDDMRVMQEEIFGPLAAGRDAAPTSTTRSRASMRGRTRWRCTTSATTHRGASACCARRCRAA